MQFDLHQADVLDSDAILDQLDPIRIGPKPDRVEAIAPLELWITCLLSRLDPPEKCLVGEV